MVLFLLLNFFFSFGWVCKCIGGGRWGHQKLYNSPVMLVVMASLLHMNNCRIHVVYVQLIKCKIISLIEKKCLVVVFDRPCSKFVVMLLFRLYSCTFVNVYAVNGMSFTLFGEKRQKCAF